MEMENLRERGEIEKTFRMKVYILKKFLANGNQVNLSYRLKQKR